MSSILKSAYFLVAFFSYQIIFGAIISDTIAIANTGDGFVNSAAMGANYSGNASLYIGKNMYVTSSTQRIFIMANLSSIPVNAMVISAKLRLNATTVTNTGDHKMIVTRATSGWTESDLKFSPQPAVGGSNISISHLSTSATGWQNFDITSFVQLAVSFPAQNYGWRIQLDSETSTTNRGVVYASANNSTSSIRPYLVIQYVLPIEVSGLVSHCSSGANDGAIKASISQGTGNYVWYEWFHYNAGTVTSIESGSNMANKDISGLADGLYMLTVQDDSDYVGYKYFLVGEYGATTTVEFKNNSSTANSILYNEDANLPFTVSGSVGTVTGGTNAGSDANRTSAQYNSSLLKYQVDFDSLFAINTAELRWISAGHYKNASPVTTDSGYVSRVTTNWHENITTWNTKPSTTTTNRVTINETSPAGAVTRNDNIDIKNFIAYWQDNPTQNYGVDLSLKKYSQASNAYLKYYSYDNSTAANRPSFYLSYSLPNQIITQYVDSIDAGHITVTAPSGELPYTYLISRDTLVSMQDFWDEIKDSTRVDSTYFFEGKSNTQTFKFKNLPSDRYYVGVYDNNGVQMMTKEVILTPAFERAYASVNFEYVSGVFRVKTPGTYAQATLLTRLPAREDGGVEFQVTQLTSPVRFGFTDVDGARPSSRADYTYGVEIKTTGKMYLTRSDTLVDSTTVIVGDRIILSREAGIVYLYKNNVVVGDDAVPKWETEDWKVDLELVGASAVLKPAVLYKKLKLPKPKVTIHYPECGEVKAYVNLSLPSGTFYGITNLTFQLKNQAGSVLYSGTSIPPLMLLSVGIYTLHYTYLLGGVSYSGYYDQIAVGYPVQWNWDPATDNITPLLSTINSISPTNYLLPAEAGGENQCEDNPSVLNWVQFETRPTKMIHVDPMVKQFSYEEIQLKTDGNAYAKVRIEEIVPGMVSRYVFLYNGVSQESYYLTSSVMPFSVEFPTDGSGNYDKVELYQEDMLQGDFDTNIDGIMTVHAKAKGYVAIEKTIVSFCGENKVRSYADVTRKLDGGFYLAKKGVVKFIYEEEYKDLNAQLTFNIYDETNQVVISNGMVPQPVAYGDNRYELDFSCIGSYTLSDGIYILEVINEKNEKWYLRFKVTDNC